MNGLLERIRSLKVGSSIYVKTDAERKEALAIARHNKVTLATRKSKHGGFNCTRMPE